jgi:glycosyltransferase involved in cell wall biosynthesis
MRLLFVVPEYGASDLGGIATYYAHLLPALVSAGCRVHVRVAAEPRKDCDSPDEIDGVSISYSSEDAVAASFQKLSHLAAFPDIRHSLAMANAAWEAANAGEGYDVVETTDYGLTFVPWVSSGRGPPIVVQLHGSVGQVAYHDPIAEREMSGCVARLFEIALLGRAEELQSSGAQNGRDWAQLLNRSVEQIWPAWTPTPAGATAGELPKSLDIPNSAVVVGRIQSWKGPDVLARSLALLGDRAPPVCWFGRDSPYLTAADSMTANLRARYPGVWGGKIRAVGEYPRRVVEAAQRTSRFIIVPSLWDPFNLAAVEGLSAGKVVVCSDAAGAADLIQHGVNGFRFPSGDASALAKVIAHVDEMSDRERETIGARARSTVDELLASETIVARRLERYRFVRSQGMRRTPNPWGETAFAGEANGPPFAFLEALPLRPIVWHATRRAIEKSRRMFARAANAIVGSS